MAPWLLLLLKVVLLSSSVVHHRRETALYRSLFRGVAYDHIKDFMSGLIHCPSCTLLLLLLLLYLYTPTPSSFSDKSKGQSMREHGVTTADGGPTAGGGSSAQSSDGSLAALARYSEETARREELFRGLADDAIEDFMKRDAVDDQMVRVHACLYGMEPSGGPAWLN